MIGGNVYALLQVKDSGAKNVIGEAVHEWVDCTSVLGWLDLQGGDSRYNTFNAKVQESTHIFISDFQTFTNLSKHWVWNPFSFVNGVIKLKKSDNWKWSPFNLYTGNIANYEEDEIVDVTSENARIIINGVIYDILLIDNPMGMNEHLEIYLKYIGGGL